jgi:hypothetical protein
MLGYKQIGVRIDFQSGCSDPFRGVNMDELAKSLSRIPPHAPSERPDVFVDVTFDGPDVFDGLGGRRMGGGGYAAIPALPEGVMESDIPLFEAPRVAVVLSIRTDALESCLAKCDAEEESEAEE